MAVRIINADVMDGLRQLPDESVQCVVTSPPYWGLRDYGVEGQIGLEKTPAEFVARMVEVFEEVRRVLRKDGVCFVNLGDSYNNFRSQMGPGQAVHGRDKLNGKPAEKSKARGYDGLKEKDLVGIPWRVAFALQDAGWWLRQDIIWCLSGGAWVYARTAKGDMPVMVKDLVRLDPSTVSLWNGEKWTQVLGWGPSNDTTERLELVLRSGERIGCTGGHLWPTKRGNVAARDLRVSDVIRSCTLPEPDGVECPPYLTHDALWLIGLFLAEGSWSGGKAQLALSADEKEWLPRIAAVARHYGGTCTHTLSGNNLSVRLYGSVFAAILNAYIGGRAALDKHLKNAAWRLPNAALANIIAGYLDGDAHRDPGSDRWRIGFCRNYALERDLRTAAARLGATLTLKPMVASYQGGELPAFRGEWRWTRSGHHNEKDRGEIVEIRQSRARQFWDIAVEDDPHLFALASGVLTHNCKPNPMPESVTDRCTKSHEYIFHFSKSARYFWDQAAIRESADWNPEKSKMPDGWDTGAGGHGSFHRQGREKGQKTGAIGSKGNAKTFRGGTYVNGKSFDNSAPLERDSHGNVPNETLSRNKRSVWSIATAPFPEAHFATFPPELPEICIKAGSKPGDTILDPFGGAGTTGLVADRLQRNAIMIELNPTYADMARARVSKDRGALLELMEPSP